MKSLDVVSLDIEHNDKADERIKEECCPGAPFVIFNEAQYVNLTCSNPQDHNGLFDLTVPVLPGDDCRTFIRRLTRESRQLRETSNVKIYRYEDPNAGPRKIPVLGKVLDGKVEMSVNGKLDVDVEKKVVTLVESGKKFELGDQIIYCVN